LPARRLIADFRWTITDKIFAAAAFFQSTTGHRQSAMPRGATLEVGSG